jgi:very-short-patch-repair endonuclease
MNQLQVIEQHGVRVLTTSQLAEAYGTDSKQINRNFQRNNDRYKEGKHYFALTGEELKEFKNRNNLTDLKFVSIMYLWTFDGCVIHANSLRNVPVKKIFEIADAFGINTKNLIIAGECSKEYQFDLLLESIVPDGLKIEKQFSLGNYRIDFYLPSIQLVIEFDEEHHKQYAKYDDMRQTAITELLPNVSFIRVKESNIYEGLKQITNFIYNKIRRI